jgi:hypothetical protein
MSFRFTSDQVRTVGDLFTVLSTTRNNQPGWSMIYRICDICHESVGETEVKEYTCSQCKTSFDVAHDCKVERTDQCPPGFGCKK